MKGLIMFKKILIAADGSSTSLKAAEKAIGIARQFDARLKVVVVIDQRVFFIPHDYLPESSGYFKVLEELRAGAERILNTIQKAAEKAGLEKLEVEILEGSVVDEIVAAAKKFRADLLIIGAVGKTGAERGVLGSTAQALTTQSPCSLMIVKK